MKVRDILRVKGSILYVVHPDDNLTQAIAIMAEKNIGSLVVVANGRIVGMLTFREVFQAIVQHSEQVGNILVRAAMNAQPLLCPIDASMERASQLMLEHHARYMPVVQEHMLMGVVSFYDIAKAMADSQIFENQMLKAYIRDWPAPDEGAPPPNTPPLTPTANGGA